MRIKCRLCAVILTESNHENFVEYCTKCKQRILEGDFVLKSHPYILNREKRTDNRVDEWNKRKAIKAEKEIDICSFHGGYVY